MTTVYDVIIEPLITEKLTAQAALGKYGFRVHPDANKLEIKAAVEKIYNVKVVKVNASRLRGKLKRVRFQPGYTASWKKAVVTLKAGDKIEWA